MALCFSFEPPLLLFFLLQQSFARCPRSPQFQHSIESLFLPVLVVLASLCFCPCRAALFALPFAKRTDVHQVVSSWISRAFLLCVPNIRVDSALTVCFDLYSQDAVRIQSRTVQLHMLFEIIRHQKLHVNSCRCPPQECARILGNLVDQSSVSRDLPSFRWRPSTLATSLAMATKSPSQDLALVPRFAGHTFFATFASYRSHGHLLLASQHRSSHRL